ncbi:acylphosphatase [Mesorhizobium sp. M00.F.Ca.ET.170.01.1.1]|nr:acylphosphatase [Mesorhizobium sp. M00.F.Ca.ET.170.01.1.1]
MQDLQRTVRARIFGRVQGVSYRVWARSQAQSLGLAGWVRNEGDGSVLALISGPEAAITAMIERLWQGPRGASVAMVEIEEGADDDAPSDFRIVI